MSDERTGRPQAAQRTTAGPGREEPRVRAFAAGDLEDLREVCLRTADLGADGSALTAWPDLVGDVYAAPYAVSDPGLVTVLELDGRVVGYVIGCRDTLAFEAWCAAQWWPALRARYPAPGPDASAFDAPLLRQVHTAPEQGRPHLATHPSHLHIDLLPVAQGRGLGRRLVEHLLGQLREAGSPGVHLGVAAANTGAVAFYRRLGFRPLVEPGPRAQSYVLGRSLTPASDGAPSA